MKNPAIKALFTRLLFSLSRCSRLLITEQLNMFTAEPRAQRFANAPSMRGGPSYASRGAQKSLALARCRSSSGVGQAVCVCWRQLRMVLSVP